jgi:hypothetical protein
MPILGIMASQISGHLFGPTGAYDSIATTTLSTATASITFSSIPATYTHLQIRGIARRSSGSTNTIVRFNSDSGSNYATHYLVGNGASASAGAESSATRFYLDILTSSATSYAASVMDILDYSNTNKYKTAKTLSGIDLNGSGTVWMASGLWMNTNAITTVTLSLDSGSNFEQYSSFALYGIKGGN